MALSFEDEMVAFIKHNLEQNPGWQHMTSGVDVSQHEVISAATKMIGVHNQAFLLVAQEIDKLRAATEGG